MEITKELFVIPEDDKYILYAPLKGSALEVEDDVIDILRELEKGYSVPKNHPDVKKLYKNGILHDGVENSICFSNIKGIPFEPTGGTIMPTSNCNLKCVYCYADAGAEKNNISREIAYAAIDFMANNALKHRTERVELNLHGGGEPLLLANWPVVTDIVKRAQDHTARNGLYLSISATTNGVLNDKQRKWVARNIDKITISLDGPEDIQNRQRPRNSYKHVIKTAEFLENMGSDYRFRATITDYSVERMVEIAEFFHGISKSKVFRMEPMTEIGRGIGRQYKSPDSERFIQNYIRAMRRADELGTELQYLCGTMKRITNRFCNACGINFCITPEGYMSPCHEITKPSDPRAEKFFFGKYNPETRKFDVNMGKLDYLRSRTVDNIPYCSDCFAKYNCAGDSPAKLETSSNMYDPSSSERCHINRTLLLYHIKKNLERGERNETRKAKI